MAEYIPVQSPVVFAPKLFTYLSGLVAIMLKIATYALYLYGILIIVIPDFRVFHLNWALVSISLGIFLSFFSRYLSANYGPTKLVINEREIKFRSFLGRSKSYRMDYILHIEPLTRKYLKFLPRSFEIYTTDNKFVIKSLRWKNQQKLIDLMNGFQSNVVNIYVKNAYYKNSFRNMIHQLTQSTQGKIGAFILVLYSIMALIGGFAYLFDPPMTTSPTSWILFNPEYILYFLPQYSSSGVLTAPNSDFWFGTDFIGRDIFSRMIFGTTITMAISIFAALLTTLFISFFGLSSAIYGGTYDAFLTRLSDVLLTFPQVVWIVLISVFSTPLRVGLPGGFFIAVYVGMSFVMWPLGARLVRSEVLEAMNAEYVQAIEIAGAKRLWILRKHIFPKVISTIFLLFFYQLSDIIIGISLLGYLGFGSESTIVWGSDLAKAFEAENIQNEWWTILFPSLFIFGIVFGLTLFSDALRDSYSSKFRGGRSGTLHSSFGGHNK